jgi:peptidyl-prolyl cis-trans isomerase D
MLESMRNQAQSWLAKLILGGIALSFVLWGVGDYFLGGSLDSVAEVDGKPISNAEYYQIYERQKNAYRQMLGKNYSSELVASLNLKEKTLQTLINRHIMLDVASDLGLAAPEQVVLSNVQKNPAFQSASGFDPQRYQILTRNMGFSSAKDYENDIRLSIMVDALQKAISDSARVSEREVRESFNRQYEQRVLEAIIVDPDSLLTKTKVDEAEAKVWYEAHKDDYRSPLRVKLNIVDINPAELTQDISIDEADIRAAYENRENEFSEPEQRKARHVLVKMAPDASEEVRAAARKKIEAIQLRIKSGEDFATVAKEDSDDLITRDKGGDLGWFKQGTMVAAFDQAVFSMSKGETSDIIESLFGYHIIRLEDIRKARIKDLAEVRDILKDELVKVRAAEEAYKLSQDLDEALGMEDSFKAAADSVNLKMQTIDPVSLDEAIAQPLLSDPQLRSKVFATMPGQAIEIEETAEGHFVAFEVVERIEPEVMEFAKVAAKALEDARRDAAHKQARRLADEIRQAGDKSLDVLAQEFGQAKFISKPVRSNGEGDEADWLTSNVLSQAFHVNQGAWVEQTIRVPQGFAVVRVEKVIPASEDEFKNRKDEIAREAEKTKGQIRFARWMASVRDRHEITSNRQVLDRY